MSEIHTRAALTTERRGLQLFDEKSDGDFYSNARQIEEWADADGNEMHEASRALTIGGLREGIAVAESISREHARRAERAMQVAEQLRYIARQAADMGREEAATEAKLDVGRLYDGH